MSSFVSEVKRDNSKKIKYLFNQNKKQISPDKMNGVVVYHYSIPNVQEFKTGCLEEGSEIQSNKFLIENKQLLISKLNPRKSTICMAEPNIYTTVCSTEFIGLTPLCSEVDLEYAFYVLSMRETRELLDSMVESVTNSHERVQPEKFENLYFTYPSVEKQKITCRYLDKRINLIDESIEKIQRKIILLNEQRTSMIHQCITKGLNPNAQMKDSGIDWIPRVPSHWEVVKPKYKLNRVTRPIDDNDEVITCFRDGVVTLRKNRREDGFTIALKEHGYQQIRPGDLVVHEMDGFAGAIGISDSKGKATPVYTVIEPDDRTDLRYISYLLRVMSQTGKIESLARSIRERTTDFRWNMWSVIHFPFPPVEEQKMISSYLDKKTIQIDCLIMKLQKKIILSKEYRESLISSVITGKFKL